MAPAAIEDVFDLKRLPDGLHFILLLFYFPLGTFLCILRLLFCIQIGIILLILPKCSILKRIILRINGMILGLFLFVDKQEKSPHSKILVCNSVSQIDSLVLESVESHFLVSKAHQLPSLLQWLMGYCDFRTNSSTEISDQLKQYCNQAESKSSVLIFPEESATNGRTSLLKFSSWPFQMNTLYQPIVLTAKRPPFVPIKLTTINAGLWSDFLWTLFVPYTIFRVRYLPTMQKEDSVPPEDFAKSVNKAMVDSLRLQPSQFDCSEKKEFLKRLQRDLGEKRLPLLAQTTQRPKRTGITSQMDQMVQQAKAVLPQVPIDAIRREILRSKSVDATIANILEGNVLYTPLTTDEVEKEKTNEIKRREEMERKNERQQTQVKHLRSSNRDLSYQERKKIMINEARRRYLEKHPEYEQ